MYLSFVQKFENTILIKICFKFASLIMRILSHLHIYKSGIFLPLFVSYTITLRRIIVDVNRYDTGTVQHDTLEAVWRGGGVVMNFCDEYCMQRLLR
jgi:hypothetical protein